MTTQTELSPGSVLLGGKYKIEAVLGQGGFGITYLAEQVSLDRKVAIKEFFPKSWCERDSSSSYVNFVTTEGRANSASSLRQFKKEAKIIAGINHPNIIRVYDVFDENGTSYYVMEFHSRGSLSSYVNCKGRLSEDEAVGLIRQVGSALSYIHSMNINHLDIKPGNILLDSNMRPVLIDFGQSKRYDDSGNQTSINLVGISKGYAPMEQYKTGGVGTFSPTTDIYSLGATLFKLVTGQTPPDADVINDEGFPELNIHLSSSVRNAMEKAMRPRRKDRPQSVEDFLAMLGSPSESVESYESTINVEAYNGHEYVDLGLSVKWATMNVGASSPSDYGDYYAWGETSTKTEYTESNSLTYKKSMGDISGNPSYDVARKKWGGSWRLPTKSEFEELESKCTWKWTTEGGHNGYRVTGPNGRSIFLPAAGSWVGASFRVFLDDGNYCSSTSFESNTEIAYKLMFSSNFHRVSWYARSCGLSVRPVLD